MDTTEDLILPKGLPLESADPQWLTTTWPFNTLDSSIASVMMTMGTYVLLAAALFFVAYLAKTFLPGALKKLVSLILILAGFASIAAGAYVAVVWNQDNTISDESMGVQVARIGQWLPSQNVTADNRAMWDLVCYHYDNRNDNCTGEHATVYQKGQPIKVRLETTKTGTVTLYDFEHQLPLNE